MPFRVNSLAPFPRTPAIYAACIRNSACAAPSPSSGIPAPPPGSILRGCACSSPNRSCCNSNNLVRACPRPLPKRGALSAGKGSPRDRTGAPTTSQHPLHGPHTTRASSAHLPPTRRNLTATAAKARVSSKRLRFGTVMRQGWPLDWRIDVTYGKAYRYGFT